MLDTLKNWFQSEILILVVALALFLLLIPLIKKILLYIIKKKGGVLARAIAQKAPWVRSFGKWCFYLVFSLLTYAVFQELSSSKTYKFANFFHTAFKIWIGVNAIFIACSLVSPLLNWVQNRWLGKQDKFYNHLFIFLKKTLKFLVFVLGGLILIQNLGVNITSLLAGLGIGGLAVALAAKDTLSNVFGSIVIVFDRPFVTGDWIQVENVEGTVENIGFRSTQIKTFYDSIISVPNSVLATAKIDNMGKRKSRRARFTLGITYDTPPEKIELFVEGIKKIIIDNPKTKKDFQVSFSDYADSSLNIFVNLFLLVAHWNEELQYKQIILLDILKLAQKLEIQFAFPSQSLYIEHIKNAPPAPTKQFDFPKKPTTIA